MTPLRIRFERTGGVAGTRLACEVPFEALAPDHQQQIARLANDPSAAAPPPETGEADRFEYCLAIDTSRGTRTVRLGESTVPDALRPLIGWLVRAAKR